MSALTDRAIELVYVDKTSQAMRALAVQSFDLVLLDDRLSQGINALFSVPMMTTSGNSAPIVIISNEPNAPHLSDVGRLGVQHVISKTDLKPFLEEWLSVNT